jgi:hypothetical protein
VTCVPGANAAAHVAPQLIPPGVLLTLPDPWVETDSTKAWNTKVAVTVGLAPRVTAQVLVPEQPRPLQPPKMEPRSACAVRVTVVPGVKAAAQVTGQPIPLQPVNTLPAAGAAGSITTAPAPKVREHTLPQLIPAGADTTVPVPVPVGLMGDQGWVET